MCCVEWVPVGLYEVGAQSWTGNSMVEECWSNRGQKHRKAKKNKKKGKMTKKSDCTPIHLDFHCLFV